MADVNVYASLQGVFPDNLGEVVGEFIAPIGIGELKAVSAEDKACVRILNCDRRRGRWCSGKIEVIIAAEVKAKFIDVRGIESGLQRNLKELTGRSIGEGQTVTGRCRSVEIAVRTAKSLIVVGNAERVLVV